MYKKIKKKFASIKICCNFAIRNNKQHPEREKENTNNIKQQSNMKVINERTAQIKVKRSYDEANQWAKVTVTECKTIYLVTIQIIGYSLPSVMEWKISKKEAANMLVAAMKIAEKAYISGNL